MKTAVTVSAYTPLQVDALDKLPARVIIFLILPVTTLAPSFGALGTPARFLLALAAGVVVLHRPARLQVPNAMLFTAFVLILSAQAVGAPYLGYGLTRLANWVMFMPLLFIGGGVERLLIVGRSLFVTCWVQVGGVLLQLTGQLGGTWGGLLTSGSYADPAQRNWLTRFTGFVGNPNDLGLLLSLGVMMCVLSVAMGVLSHKTILLGSAGVFVWVIFLTGSRGAILGLVIGMIVSLAFLSGRQRVLVSTISALAGALILTRSGAFSIVVNSIGEIFAGQDASASFRTSLWHDRLSLDHSWLFGGGFGAYAGRAITGSGGLGVDQAVQESTTIDNGWLKLFLEGGGLAVTALALLLLSILASALTKHVRASVNPLATSVVFTSMTMILWRSLSADLFDINPWNAVIWLNGGLAVGLAAQRAKHGVPRQSGLYELKTPR